MKLSEPQKRVLKTMLDFDCLVHSSVSDGYHWYGGHALYGCPGRKVRGTTIRALIKRQLVLEKVAEKGRPYWRRDFVLTPKGCEIVKELQND